MAINDLDQRLTLAIKDTIYRVVGNDTTAQILKADVFSHPAIETRPGIGTYVSIKLKVEVNLKP
jgi:hypothetical protein